LIIGLAIGASILGWAKSIGAFGAATDIAKNLWNKLSSSLGINTQAIKGFLKDQVDNVSQWALDHGIDVVAIKEKWEAFKDFLQTEFMDLWERFVASIDTISDNLPSALVLLESLATTLELVADSLERIKNNPVAAIIGALVGFRLGRGVGAVVGAVGGSFVGQGVQNFGSNIEQARAGSLAGQLPPTQLNITLGGTITAAPGSVDEQNLFQRIGEFITRHLADLARR